MDCSPPGSSVHGISQARTLEWVAMSSSGGSSPPRNRTCVSCSTGGLFTTEPPRKPLKCEHTISLFHLALLRKQKPKIQQIIMLVWMMLTFIKLNFKHFFLYKMSLGSTLISHCNGSGTLQFFWSAVYLLVIKYAFSPLERKWQPTPVFLRGQFHRQRSLVGCSSWSCKGQTQLRDKTTTVIIVKENPLQNVLMSCFSCLPVGVTIRPRV